VDALLDLPEDALADSCASRDRARRLDARLSRLAAGTAAAAHPAEAQEPAARPRRGPTAYLTAAAVHRHLANCNVTKAANCLDEAPIAEASPEVIERLITLHPEEPQPEVPAPDDAPLEITQAQLADVLHNLPRGKAGGPSGWTYEHVRAAANSSKACFDAILRLVNGIVRGALPHTPRLFDCRLLPTGSLDTKIRPIAISEVWLRIAALCALAALPGIGNSLLHLQVGVGVSGGAEIVPHALRAALAAAPGSALLRVDFSNAFNAMRRAPMLRAVSKRCPKLFRLAHWLYGRHTRLWVEGAPASAAPIISQRGARQGDPLGPTLFALTLQDALEEVPAQVPTAAPLALHDDVTVHGCPAALGAARSVLEDNAGPLGLDLAIHKCGVYAESAAVCEAAAIATGVPACPDGIAVGGSPIGTDAFVLEFMRAKTDKVAELVGKAQELPLAEQDRCLLLRLSLSARLTYAARTAPVGQCAAQVHALLDNAAAAVALGAVAPLLPFKGHTAAAQLHLPLRLGGLGFRRLDPDEHAAAGVASLALAQSAMATGPALFRPLDGPQRPLVQATWRRICERAPTISEADDVGDAHARGDLANAQRALSKVLQERAHEALLLSEDATSDSGRRTLSRLHSVGCSQAGAWLEALPTHPALTLRNGPFRAALRRRLGESTVPPAPPGLECYCGTDLHAATAEHLLSCRAVNRLWTMRHDAMRGITRAAMRRAGIASSVEPQLAALHREAQRADTTRHPRTGVGDSRGDILAVVDSVQTVYDVVVIHPGCASHRKAAAESVGGAVERAARGKFTTYARREGAFYEFVPLAAETHGRLGREFMQLINALGARAAGSSRGQFTKQTFINGVCRELSVALCVYNAMVENAVAGFYARAAGDSFVEGLASPSAEVGDEASL